MALITRVCRSKFFYSFFAKSLDRCYTNALQYLYRSDTAHMTPNLLTKRSALTRLTSRGVSRASAKQIVAGLTPITDGCRQKVRSTALEAAYTKWLSPVIEIRLSDKNLRRERCS